MLVEKEVIRPGTYFYKDETTGLPRKLVVTPELTKHWHDEGNKMIGFGLQIPVPYEHDFQAHPMTPKDKLLNNAGEVKGYSLKGNTLFSSVDVQDPAVKSKIGNSIRWTSPWINSFTDGDGRNWKNVISHLALTTRPRITKQEPFGSIAAALSMASETTVNTISDKGVCLSRAGLLTQEGQPEYPIAFSLWGGVALTTDASGHSHDESGKFGKGGGGGGGGNKSSYAHSLSTSAGSHDDLKHIKGKAQDHADDSMRASVSGDHKMAAYHHMKASAHHYEMATHPKHEGTKHQKSHIAVMVAHNDAAQHHMLEHQKKAGGKAMALDASGHEHGEAGKFTGHANNAARASNKTRTNGLKPAEHHVATDMAKNLSRKAAKSGSIEDHKSAADAHEKAGAAHRKAMSKWGSSTAQDAQKLYGMHYQAAHHHEQAYREHSDATRVSSQLSLSIGDYHEQLKGIAMGAGIPPKKAPKPGEEQDPGVDEGADDDGDVPGDLDDDGDADADDADALIDAPGDIGMEELLCDLLQALGVPMPDESNEQEFKRHLYEAVMSKIKELTSQGLKDDQDKNDPTKNPDQNKPPNQNPNTSHPNKAPNPLIQQEQQPMYMSLEEINKLPDPMKGVALAMYNENAKLRAELDAGTKVTNSLRDSKLKEENAKRTSRVALLSRLSPKVKADLDAMLALPSMALSMGDGGAVVDPMAQTLAILEKGLADMPRLLTTDHTALSVQPHPHDADAMTTERADAIADGLARQMGCPPEQKKAG